MQILRAFLLAAFVVFLTKADGDISIYWLGYTVETTISLLFSGMLFIVVCISKASLLLSSFVAKQKLANANHLIDSLCYMASGKHKEALKEANKANSQDSVAIVSYIKGRIELLQHNNSAATDFLLKALSHKTLDAASLEALHQISTRNIRSSEIERAKKSFLESELYLCIWLKELIKTGALEEAARAVSLFKQKNNFSEKIGLLALADVLYLKLATKEDLLRNKLNYLEKAKNSSFSIIKKKSIILYKIFGEEKKALALLENMSSNVLEDEAIYLHAKLDDPQALLPRTKDDGQREFIRALSLAKKKHFIEAREILLSKANENFYRLFALLEINSYCECFPSYWHFLNLFFCFFQRESLERELSDCLPENSQMIPLIRLVCNNIPFNVNPQ